jgi:hypothetical protein
MRRDDPTALRAAEAALSEATDGLSGALEALEALG